MKFVRARLAPGPPAIHPLSFIHSFFFVSLPKSRPKTSGPCRKIEIASSVSFFSEAVLKIGVKRVASARDSSSHVPRNSLDSLNHRVES